ncbi:C39 family peptidase [Hahella aquimaris]|uniref:C39 family peptidase n=1 Tax=Hahella sp. HNIBRBA332 TaxID=3015983 RepID=UPI00273B924E|nr:C39 family peptidase [Hahella sp. HNIBRBA332]WLQ15297.1 C39 family peptidase [Hahella sp. HNIBRBA332]
MLLVLAGSVLAFNIANEAAIVEPQPKGVVVYQQAISTAGNDVAFLRYDTMVEPAKEQKFRNITRQAYDYSCGSAALTTVLEHYLGRTFEERQIMEGLLHYGDAARIVERRGFSMLDFKRLVTALGYPSGGFKAEIEDLAELDHPAIVPIRYGGFKHFIVVRAVRDNRVFVADPSLGNITFTVELFKEHWDQNVLFIVFPGNTKPVDGLELREEDMRYVDEQTFTLNAYREFPQFHEATEFRIRNELERLKNNEDGSVNNTNKYLHYKRN